MKRLLLIGVLACLAAVTVTAQPVEFEWWYALGGKLGDKIVEFCDRFNASQKDYKVVGVFKGDYPTTMNAGIAAFRAGKPPHILQVFEVGTGTMMAAKGAVKPVYQLMAETGQPFDPEAYIAPVAGYYSTTDGRMLSLPFNSSTTVLYWNKDAFRKAGLDPEKPPKTWPEVEQIARTLAGTGLYKAALASAWMSWVQLENFSAWHNLPFGTRDNGMSGLDSEFTFNGPYQIRHIENLNRWQKDKMFAYVGRAGAGNVFFSNGEIPMMFESSAGYAGFKATCKFPFGVTQLPYYPDIPGAPQNSIIGGASLWVLNGRKAEEYKGVAKFFSFLSQPDIQAEWHQFTGYVPITTAAYELSRKQGFYDRNPGMDIAIKQLTNKKPTANSKGLRFGYFVEMRNILDETFEAIFAGKVTTKQGLDEAVQKGNALLRQFERVNR
jgi:sn-glycerol 3-phosphate transport system substrate-binding protein